MSVEGGTISCMNSELPYPLCNLADRQNGVVSRAQALRSGLTADMIKSRVSGGRWRQLHPGIYATFTETPGRSARLWAAVLSAGSGAVLSHETAAELHALTDQAADPIHVTVPWQRRVVAVPDVSIHRSRRSDELPQGGTYPPRTKIEETVLDLTQTAKSFDDACSWVTRAFARDLTDESRLRRAMSERTKLRWRADLRELIAAAAGSVRRELPRA
jgi:predicted transcriptional regulator of viral defense system